MVFLNRKKTVLMQQYSDVGTPLLLLMDLMSKELGPMKATIHTAPHSWERKSHPTPAQDTT